MSVPRSRSSSAPPKTCANGWLCTNEKCRMPHPQYLPEPVASIPSLNRRILYPKVHEDKYFQLQNGMWQLWSKRLAGPKSTNLLKVASLIFAYRIFEAYNDPHNKYYKFREDLVILNFNGVPKTSGYLMVLAVNKLPDGTPRFEMAPIDETDSMYAPFSRDIQSRVGLRYPWADLDIAIGSPGEAHFFSSMTELVKSLSEREEELRKEKKLGLNNTHRWFVIYGLFRHYTKETKPSKKTSKVRHSVTVGTFAIMSYLAKEREVWRQVLEHYSLHLKPDGESKDWKRSKNVYLPTWMFWNHQVKWEDLTKDPQLYFHGESFSWNDVIKDLEPAVVAQSHLISLGLGNS